VKLNRLVALNMVLREHWAGSKDLIRFLAEAEVVAAVKYPYVVQVYEYDDANGRPFLAMVYLPGGSLADRLQRTGRLDSKAAAELVATLAGAFQAAHALGIVHRDSKRIPKAASTRLFDYDFIKHHGDAVLIGPTGTGKTYLLTALGYMAVERGHSVCHTWIVNMINHLTTTQLNGSLGKTLRTYIRPRLLLLDELGYLPIAKQGADLLFQIIAIRYEVRSIVITTSRAFREWDKILDVDNTLATALINRLIYHGERIVIQGDSYHMKDKDPDLTDECLKHDTSTFRSGVRCEVSWFWHE
jgi:DNA replication protein DnaC